MSSKAYRDLIVRNRSMPLPDVGAVTEFASRASGFSPS